MEVNLSAFDRGEYAEAELSVPPGRRENPRGRFHCGRDEDQTQCTRRLYHMHEDGLHIYRLRPAEDCG